MILELCKGVHCVDLDESFQTHIYLQNLASIQPRTSPLKFAGAPLQMMKSLRFRRRTARRRTRPSSSEIASRGVWLFRPVLAAEDEIELSWGYERPPRRAACTQVMRPGGRDAYKIKPTKQRRRARARFSRRRAVRSTKPPPQVCRDAARPAPLL